MYCLIRSKGYDSVKSDFKKANFYRLIADLELCGFSRAVLMNLNENGNCPELKNIDLLQVFNIDFENQVPNWYIEPKSKFSIEEVA